MSDSSNKLNELSNLESNAQYLMSQRHALKNELLETDSALEELKNTDESFRIIGSIMVKSDKSKIEKDLLDKKELVEKRLKGINEKESELRKQAEKLQSELMKELEKKR